MSYPLLCALLGVVLGLIPGFLHGPIPYKFNVLGINGALESGAFWVARLLIGVWVGISVWPPRWYVRGPLCGFLAMLPVGLVALATPGCGPT